MVRPSECGSGNSGFDFRRDLYFYCKYSFLIFFHLKLNTNNLLVSFQIKRPRDL